MLKAAPPRNSLRSSLHIPLRGEKEEQNAAHKRPEREKWKGIFVGFSKKQVHFQPAIFFSFS